MMRAVPGRPTRTARLGRALGLDGNPLRRASDRAEAWIRAGLLVVFLVAGPLAAIAAGHSTADAQASGSPGEAGLAAILALVVVAFALMVAMRLIQLFLNWRRLAAWEQAWRATGPRWTGHRS
jgi:hypothetical protein